MRTKKKERVNLEKKRHLFFLVGLTMTLGVTLMAFEWHSDTENTVILTSDWVQVDETLIPITRVKEPPKPKLKKQKIVVFDVVDDKEEIEIPDLDFADTEETGEAIEDIPMDIEVDNTPIPWSTIEVKPEFVGGEEGMMAFISKNTIYPESAKEVDIQGIVYVEFVVGKDGLVKDVVLRRGVDPSLDKEALRVVQMMPKWKPGKQRGKAVAVSYIIPFSFKLGF